MNIATEALSLFSSGTCNLGCKYCYIPKFSSKDLHRKVIEQFPASLAHFGKPKHISLWGTEPTLSLPNIAGRLYDLVREGEVETLTFSSNFTLLDPLIDFIKGFPKGRKCSLKLQVSFDGAPGLTDLNRGSSVAGRIETTLLGLLAFLSTYDLGNIRIDISNKSTWTTESLRYLIADTSRVKEHFSYFDYLTGSALARNRNSNVSTSLQSYTNMEHPGKFTSEDGKLFYRVVKEIDSLIEEDKKCRMFRYIRPVLLYSPGVRRVFDFSPELYNKFQMFTCSGGKSQFGLGLDNNLHICHRAFVYDDPEYLDKLKQAPSSHFDGIVVEGGTLDLLLNRYRVKVGDEKERVRFYYVMGGYHGFTKFKFASSYALLKEMLEAGQVDPAYSDDSRAYLLILLSHILVSCPIEFILATGSPNVMPKDTMRLFGNGALEVIVNRALQDRKYAAC